MPTLLLSTLLGLVSAVICLMTGQITLVEALAIYSITGLTSALMLIFLPEPRGTQQAA